MVSATSTPTSFSDSLLPDNAPTLGSVLPVILLTLLVSFTVAAPWWRCFLPDFHYCGCLPCIIIWDNNEEEDVPGTVELWFARVDDAINISKAPSIATGSRMHSVPDDDESFWCTKDDDPSWIDEVDGASASDGARPSHPPGETLPASTSAPSDGCTMDLEFQGA
ncbi:hypothetical protein F4604DRAFT_1916558 [Suillus subluteus]|nr:hypothetical protein F4604DRAFT_1916558 [Suillus subluteus]